MRKILSLSLIFISLISPLFSIPDYRNSSDYKLSYLNESKGSSPAAAVEIAKNSYITCDYTSISLIDKDNGSFSTLKISGFQGRMNPAGLFYKKKTNRLVVPNYIQFMSYESV